MAQTEAPDPGLREKVLQNFFETRMRAKTLIRNVWTHDLAERLRIRRKSIARAQGMPDNWDVGTYPMPTNIVSISKAKSVLGPLLAAALASGTTAWWLGGFNLPWPDRPEQPPAETTPASQEIIIDWEVQEDGSVKFTPRE